MRHLDWNPLRLRAAAGSAIHDVWRYIGGVLVVMVALGIRGALDPLLGAHSPYLPFALALILVARFAGRGPALLGTAVGTVSADWFFVAPRHSFAIGELGGGAGLILFALVGTLISLFVGHMRESLLRMSLAEQVLRESEQRYRGLFESMQEGFMLGEIICDGAGKPVDWRFLDVNPAFEVMAGRKREDILRRTYRELFPDTAKEHWIAIFGEVALTRRSARVDQYQSATGRDLDAAVYSPGPNQFAAVLTDVTTRKKAEERLRQAQKLESIGVLAGGVAHDFNNLLTLIMGNASSALEEYPECVYSKEILCASKRATHLTQQLLAYAGKGQAVVDIVDVSRLVSQSSALLDASVPAKARLIYRLSDPVRCIEADPARVEQVLMNLVLNAGEAIPARSEGEIEISTGTSEIAEELARQQAPRYSVAPGPYVWLEVRDNGVGMDLETIGRIFDPFYSTKFAGRGLGLAAVDGIVRTAGGFINVQSSPGVGTTVRVLWPATEKRRQPVSSSVSGPSERRAAKILIVEDEEKVRKLASLMLRKSGYEVLEATHGQHAITTLAESVSPPDVILLDLAMPVMGGDELLPILAAKYPGIKIIVSSGYSEEEARRASSFDGVAAFLPKPYHATALRTVVAHVLAIQ